MRSIETGEGRGQAVTMLPRPFSVCCFGQKALPINAQGYWTKKVFEEVVEERKKKKSERSCNKLGEKEVEIIIITIDSIDSSQGPTATLGVVRMVGTEDNEMERMLSSWTFTVPRRYHRRMEAK